MYASDKRRSLAGATLTATYRCSYGEGDWEYICLARWEPTPLGVSRGKTPITQKLGIRNVLLYRGRLGNSYSVLPDEGPVPSVAELAAMREAQAAAALEKLRKQK